MSLSDKLAQVRNTSQLCAVKRFCISASDEDRDAVMSAIADETISSRALARVLAENDVDISRNSIQSHRRRECKCERS